MRNIRGIDLELLVTLEALLTACNVTHVARRLHLSQPTVSVRLGKLRHLFADGAYDRGKLMDKAILLAVAIALVGMADRLAQLHLDRRVAYAFGGAVLAVIAGLSLLATISYYVHWRLMEGIANGGYRVDGATFGNEPVALVAGRQVDAAVGGEGLVEQTEVG